jgi:hypothetical protein
MSSQMVVRIFAAASSNDCKLREELQELIGRFEVDKITLKISGGREFQFVRSMFTRHHDYNDRYFFVCNFSANQPQSFR